MVIGCRSIGSNNCIALPYRFSYLSREVILDILSTFGLPMVVDWWWVEGRHPQFLWSGLGGSNQPWIYLILVQRWLEKSMLVMIINSAIDRIRECNVVHRLVPCGRDLFQMSRSCGLLGRKFGSTLEKFDLGTSFQEVVIACCLYHL
jgi:hypothetical protein